MQTNALTSTVALSHDGKVKEIALAFSGTQVELSINNVAQSSPAPRLNVHPQTATHSYTVNNGGTGGGTLDTVAALGALIGRVYYCNGTDWVIYQ